MICLDTQAADAGAAFAVFGHVRALTTDTLRHFSNSQSVWTSRSLTGSRDPDEVPDGLVSFGRDIHFAT
mgnify:CR=1 FL=1